MLNKQNPEQFGERLRTDLIAKQRHVSERPELQQLMMKLEGYRDLKDIPLNSISDANENLWRESPCTLKNTCQRICIDRADRFKIGSIYHKDKLNEKKKIFTESEKPELLLKNFRRQIDEASSKNKYSKSKSNSKGFSRSDKKGKVLNSLRSTMPSLNNKFYEVPPKTEFKHDRNGSRSNYAGNYDVKQIMERFKSTKNNFSSSRRVDLGLPLNYYPGPGQYFRDNHDSQTFRTGRSHNAFNSVSFKSERRLNTNLEEEEEN